MLILSRKPNERIHIRLPDGTVILLTITDIDRGKVRLGFTAPREIEIHREELLREGRPQ